MFNQCKHIITFIDIDLFDLLLQCYKFILEIAHLELEICFKICGIALYYY